MERNSDDSIRVPVGTDTVELPDFRGMAKRKVLDRCAELGIQLQANGSGAAIFQQPPPGTRIPVGDVCIVTFARGQPGRTGYMLGTSAQYGPRRATAAEQAAAVPH
ncbi:MAG TPA: PASTA domain-containing protein [Acidobacteriota bacterium]|nr:PASTA domain-containing protein [Acidobacteriota bacterium]